MAEERPNTPESTDSLMRKLCFHLAENKQDVAEGFFTTMRNLLPSSFLTRRNAGSSVPQHAGSPQLPGPRSLLRGKSPVSPASSGLDEAFHTDHSKVEKYLLTTDKNVAKEFSSLSNKVLYDPDILLSERTSALSFLMKMGRKDPNSMDMIIEQTPFVLPIGLNNRTRTNDATCPRVHDSQHVRRNQSNTTDTTCHSAITRRTNSTLQPDGKMSAPNLNGRAGGVDSGVSGLSLSGSSIPNTWSHRTHSRSQPASPSSVSSKDMNYGVNEWEVIQALIFTWQGIEGDIFKLDPVSQNYHVSDKVMIDPCLRQKAESLSWLGYLYNAVLKFTAHSAHSNPGIVRRCLMAYLRAQLNDYSSLIANIRTQLTQEVARERAEKPTAKSRVTLERLRLMTLNPVRTFQDLIQVLELTEKDKGGSLASGVHCFLQSGDPEYQALVKDILSEICKPLYLMLTKWLLDGEICDEHKEFFIGSDKNIAGDRLWHEKYTLRMAMLPQFISVEQAERILSVGKSINFLKVVCEDEEPLAEKKKIKDAFLNTDVEVMYLLSREDEMTQLIDLAYKQTNQRVMSVLINKYSLLDHFQAHRKYLLLGQGDFIHHLMDLLSEVLDKPADQLAPHHLNTVLDNAVRSTSAQYEQENILNRLDAATMGHSSGDCGWDVFYLRYHVDGPIGTVFSASKDIYQLLFYALWKAKHMEMVLSKLWKKVASAAKSYRKFTEVKPVLGQCHELTSEMVHFVRQTQYYFLFEVLECSWNQLIARVHEAECLDQVIDSHQVFLRTVQAGVFKDHSSQTMANQLRIIYDLILQLQGQVDILLRDLEDVGGPSSNSTHTVLNSGDVETDRRRKDFLDKFLPNCQASLRLLRITYRDTVKKLLFMLNSHDDLSLQLLSTRLDFNELYNNLDSTLHVPLTFHHRRMSSISSSGFSPVLPRKSYSSNKSRESVD